MRDNRRRILLAADISNFEYVCIRSAEKDWIKDYPEDAAFMRTADETDQESLPSLLVSDSFRKVLKKTVQKKLESMKWIVKSNHLTELNYADGMDVIFTEDDRVSNSFRRTLYPEYKAQRKLVKKRYDVFELKNYIQDVLLPEMRDWSGLDYTLIKVEGCESDDIIAVLMKRFDDYLCRIILSSDRDFLQLEGVYQYDMWGRRIEPGFKLHDDFQEVTPKEFLLWKIIRGDTADNIKNVFRGYGDIKSYKLVKNRDELKRMLLENFESAKRFKLNKELIDFKLIPKDVEEKVYGRLLEVFEECGREDEESAEDSDEYGGNCMDL